jgi:hypothetical protein
VLRLISSHPYDDPEYLHSLPDTHPANPNSKQAQEVRELASREKEQIEARQKAKSGTTAKDSHDTEGEHRNWIQRKKDQLIGTKEERAKAKAEKKRLKEQRRRQERVCFVLCYSSGR